MAPSRPTAKWTKTFALLASPAGLQSDVGAGSAPADAATFAHDTDEQPRPGSNAGCSSFTGTIKADTASYFTTDGKFDTNRKIGVTISAPGEDQEDVTADCFATTVGILSLQLGGGKTRMSGTSMASPHVAGIVARLMQQGLSNLEIIRSWIRDNAFRKGVAPLNSPTRGYTYDREREGTRILRCCVRCDGRHKDELSDRFFQ